MAKSSKSTIEYEDDELPEDLGGVMYEIEWIV